MSTIDIEEIKLKDKEYTLDTEFTDVSSDVSAISLSDTEGPTATSFSDVTYNILTAEYVTNINTFQFASIPFNDVLSFEE